MPFCRFPIRNILAILATACPGSMATIAHADVAEKPRTVAVLVFDGVELLDFAGPAEVFIVASQRTPFQVFTVAPTGELIRTMGGIAIKPDYSFKDAPPADILVIPGGNTRTVKREGIEWIRKSAKSADVVMSVCFGAFLLAEAGLLDGITATTHRWAIEGLRKAAPKCEVVADRRFVDGGRIVTTAGVAAGIDGALHVVERLAGADVARWTAESWMEHRRQGATGQTREVNTPPSK